MPPTHATAQVVASGDGGAESPRNFSASNRAALLDGLTNDVQRSEVMATSKKDASLASKQLQDKKSTTSAKSVAGSDLAQAKGKKK